MKKLLHCIFLLAVAVFASAQDEYDDGYADEKHPSPTVVTVDEVINPHTANAEDYVSDMAHVFDPVMEHGVNDLCRLLDSEVKIQTLIVTVPSIGDWDPVDYSIALFQRIGVGDKNTNRGLLILVSVADHYWQIRTGYGLEGQFPDAICSYVGREKMVPQFKENRYAEGIRDAMTYFMELATNEQAMTELKMEMENQKKLQEEQELREALNGFWIVIGIFCLVAFGVYGMRKSMNKATKVDNGDKEKTSTDVAVVDKDSDCWSDGRRMIPQKYKIDSRNSGVIKVSEKKGSKISFWDDNKITRCMTYFVGPAVGAGAACEIAHNMDDTFGWAILACNTWVILMFFVARFRMLKHAHSPYEKLRVYEEGMFSYKTLGALVIAPWVTIPALIIAYTGRDKYKYAGPPCPECGSDMFADNNEEDLLPLLSEKETTERRLGTKKFKLYKCSNGHTVLDVKIDAGSYRKCTHCGAIAGKLDKKVEVTPATYSHSGKRIDTYICQHCGEMFQVEVILPRRQRSSSSSSSGGSSGGGGGSYGGGSTGGGGAGGRW